jgi:hypothetical protein
VRFQYGLCLAAILALTGCQTPPLCYWGNYESVAYRSYRKPGDVPAETVILQLSEDLEKAAGKGMKPNPGLHAHLGYAYYETGKPDEALKHFQAEKELYPESACFMDHLIANLKSK